MSRSAATSIESPATGRRHCNTRSRRLQPRECGDAPMVLRTLLLVWPAVSAHHQHLARLAMGVPVFVGIGACTASQLILPIAQVSTMLASDPNSATSSDLIPLSQSRSPSRDCRRCRDIGRLIDATTRLITCQGDYWIASRGGVGMMRPAPKGTKSQH